MKRLNIRTINGSIHNGHLEHRYRKIQNRAAAAIDAFNEDGESLELVAHLHRISIDQIQKDLYGEPSEIKKRFGIQSTVKLEKTLKTCLKEINKGVNKALVAVAYHVPYTLICSLENNNNIREAATKFLIDIRKKLNCMNLATIDKMIDISSSPKECTKLKSLNETSLHAINDQEIITSSTITNEPLPCTTSKHIVNIFSPYKFTESKIGIQTLHKSSSSSLINDITNSNFSTLSNNPSRVDRLIAEYHYEYTRILRLHERIKEILHMQDIEATRQTLDEWLNTINNVQDRRRQEIDNAAEKCRSGEPRLPDEKDVLQLAEALRILRITTRKIRTVLWYWLYWSTNSTTHKIPLIARHQDEQLNTEFHSIIQNDQHSTYNLFYSSTNNEDESKATLECDEQRKLSLKNSISSNDNNKENECKK
ncbi:unnamed protein product [Rotaria sordida]|uniref:Uncharacterized protein n=1 Tax=Rotaria sordida TaxID=392033 RepID=A0A813XGV6_9BILA|nr:unnamed protein product [Rotaria sordida]